MKKITPYLGGFVVLLVVFIFYNTIIVNDIKTDIQPHALAASKAFIGKTDVPPNALYYYVIYLFSGFSENFSSVLFSAICILSIMIMLKYFITYKMLSDSLASKNVPVDSSNKKVLIVTIVALMSIFLFSIPWSLPLGKLYFYYRGKLPPNIWHNSTTIFLFPFALLLFWYSYKTLIERTPKNLIITTLLVILNIAVKPSFAFVFICLFPVFSFLEYKFSRQFFLCLIPIAVGGLYIGIQYYIIYQLNYQPFKGMNTHLPVEKSGIAIAPFAVWTRMVRPVMIPFALVSSLLLPMAYFCFYFRELKEKINYYALSFFGLGLLIYILFMETGSRVEQGNFVWQTFICSYILFFVVISNILKKYFAGEFNTQKGKNILLVLSTVFLLHFISGVFYLFRILFYQSYY